LFRLGLLFFILQVAAGLAFATDNLMLAAVLGADSVPAYAVPARLFGCISLLVAILVQPLWPAYAEAAARGDFTWIRRAFKRSLLLALSVSIAASSLLYVLRDHVFQLWTQSTLAIDDRVVGMLAVWAVIDSCSIALAMLLNGLNVVRFQVAIALVLVVASFPARYFLLKTLGPWGLPLATSVVYFCTGIVPCMMVVPELLRGGRRP
jgi:O-antigen/teichoic acid export membrane protein